MAEIFKDCQHAHCLQRLKFPGPGHAKALLIEHGVKAKTFDPESGLL